jgi:hypothetical protein
MKCTICGYEIRKDKLKLHCKYKLYRKGPSDLLWEKRPVCEECITLLVAHRYKWKEFMKYRDTVEGWKRK